MAVVPYKTLTAAVIGILLFACGVRADTSSVAAASAHDRPQSASVKEHFDMTKNMARVLATITGTAINPLLVTAAVGSYRYYATPPNDRGRLPWFYSPWFWVPCAALVILAFIVSIPSVTANLPPTVSAFVELCNKNIGLIVTTPIVIGTITKYCDSIANGSAAALAPVSHVVAHASMIPAEWLASLPQTLRYAAVIPVLLFAFFAMWLFNMVFDFMILLSPFGWFDLCLKIARGIFFALLLTVSVFFPQLVFIIALPLMIVSVAMFGWSVRQIVKGVRFIGAVLSRQRVSTS